MAYFTVLIQFFYFYISKNFCSLQLNNVPPEKKIIVKLMDSIVENKTLVLRFFILIISPCYWQNKTGNHSAIRMIPSRLTLSDELK